MSLYTTGTVNMTNGSNAVVGVGTAALANMAAGDGFLIPGESVYYTVLAVADDTHFTLSVNYAGATGDGKSFQISRDWTANLGLAEIQPGDPNWPYLLTQKVIRLLDAGVQSVLTNSAGLAAALSDETGTGFVVFSGSPVFTTQITTPKIVTASGNLEITPAGNADVVLQGSGDGTVKISTQAGGGVANYGGDLVLGRTATDGPNLLGGIEFQSNLAAGAGYGYKIFQHNSGGYLGICSRWSSATWGSPAVAIQGSTGNVGIGMTPTVQFELSGSIGQKSSGTTWSNPSDARLKDIQGPADLQRCYDDVKALELKRYRVKDDCFTTGQVADRTVTGLVAGQVRKIIPKAVNVVPFTKVGVPDGIEEYQEQDFVMESVEVQEVEIIAGLPILKTRLQEQKRMLADEIQVKDDLGNLVVFVDDKGEQNPLMHSIPRMVKKTRPKERRDVIVDCLNLDMSQIYMQMFGTVQMLQLKVEALQAEIVTLKTI